jgi:hypothetical protein
MSEAFQRRGALRDGVRLEVFTVAWMVVEAVIVIGAGAPGPVWQSPRPPSS